MRVLSSKQNYLSLLWPRRNSSSRDIR
jgi:hypothetical protein